MKKIITILAVCVSIATSFAQGATLTKEETVNYINKKLAECDGHKKTVADGSRTPTIKSLRISLSDAGLVTGTMEREDMNKAADCPRYKLYNYYKFNLLHITSIELDKNYNENEAVGTIKINLLPRTGHVTMTTEAYSRVLVGRCTDWKEFDRKEETVSQVYIYYLKGDPTNFNKIKKALEYLRDLAKAEDDPFGN